MNTGLRVHCHQSRSERKQCCEIFKDLMGALCGKRRYRVTWAFIAGLGGLRLRLLWVESAENWCQQCGQPPFLYPDSIRIPTISVVDVFLLHQSERAHSFPPRRRLLPWPDKIKYMHCVHGSQAKVTSVRPPHVAQISDSRRFFLEFCHLSSGNSACALGVADAGRSVCDKFGTSGFIQGCTLQPCFHSLETC